jgi:CheY-like chemotaxis protein
MWCP